jgi:hypothetical protein
MLKLRRGVVTSADPLVVEVDGAQRPAWADHGLIGEVREGDEVIVNVEALDLGLGSGGFDVVHVNLTRGLEGAGGDGDHVMKLNYSSLQHAVRTVERGVDSPRATPPPVLALPLHGHLAPAAWAAGQARPGLKVGYVQAGGGALPGALSRDVAELRSRGLLVGHVTAGPAYGGEREAVALVGALDAAAELGWEAVMVGPGPGVIGSETRYGHGGIAALDAVHAALALGAPTILSPRMSSGDARTRHRGLSHHTAAVLELALGSVIVAAPEPGTPDELREACGDRHKLRACTVDLDAYAASGLPTRTMGRELDEDRLFFAAALAGGAALAEQAGS